MLDKRISVLGGNSEREGEAGLAGEGEAGLVDEGKAGLRESRGEREIGRTKE